MLRKLSSKFTNNVLPQITGVPGRIELIYLLSGFRAARCVTRGYGVPSSLIANRRGSYVTRLLALSLTTASAPAPSAASAAAAAHATAAGLEWSATWCRVAAAPGNTAALLFASYKRKQDALLTPSARSEAFQSCTQAFYCMYYKSTRGRSSDQPSRCRTNFSYLLRVACNLHHAPVFIVLPIVQPLPPCGSRSVGNGHCNPFLYAVLGHFRRISVFDWRSRRRWLLLFYRK